MVAGFTSLRDEIRHLGQPALEQLHASPPADDPPADAPRTVGEEVVKGLTAPSTTSSHKTAEEPSEFSTPLLLSAAPSGPTALEPIEEEQAPSPPPDKRLHLQCKRKRVTPSAQSSPLPPLGQTSSKVPKVQAPTVRVPTQDSPRVAEVPTPTPVRILAPEQADPSTRDQPRSSATSSTLPTAPSPSAAHTRAQSDKSKYNFTASWSLPSMFRLDATGSSGNHRRQLATELEGKESELATLSVDLKALQESNKALQKDLEVARADLVASAGREKALKAQRDQDQATIKSLQADLLKEQAEASTLKQENVLALAAADKVKVKLVEYRSGENHRLRAYRISYVKSSFFRKKIGDLIDLLWGRGRGVPTI
ncbi:neurofilament medium polypeptide-like [Zingiber officinale]|uniref:neurofilament medium polypeptide-like n=1 Tax=Zingiber officinale TaxID=94328 RepID=UPI001C4D7F2B|nr:neurofilament medium polypeptide-like [Zingiber officinale]